LDSRENVHPTLELAAGTSGINECAPNRAKKTWDGIWNGYVEAAASIALSQRVISAWITRSTTVMEAVSCRRIPDGLQKERSFSHGMVEKTREELSWHGRVQLLPSGYLT